MGRWSVITPLLCGVGLLLSCALASAASFYVSPVRVELSARSATAALTVRNEGERPVVIQVQPVSWSQRNGNDETAATREVIATPAVFTLPAQGSQIVRVGLRKLVPTDKEQTYRLILQEVPAPPRPGEQGVTMALRLSIPIFIAPLKPKGPALTWRAERQADGDLLVEAVNAGDTHAQITRLQISPSKTDKAIAEMAVMSYVLAGQTRQWKLKPQAMSGQRLYLQADTDVPNRLRITRLAHLVPAPCWWCHAWRRCWQHRRCAFSARGIPGAQSYCATGCPLSGSRNSFTSRRLLKSNAFDSDPANSSAEPPPMRPSCQLSSMNRRIDD